MLSVVAGRRRRSDRRPRTSCASCAPTCSRRRARSVGGTTASFVDQSDVTADRLPLFIGGVVVLSFLLLHVAFRSSLVALKAGVMNLLSIGAAYGVVAYVAEGGWAGQLVGIDTPTPVPPFIPVMMFAILFGLSMDYEVFLLVAHPRGGPRRRSTARAVSEGLARTARVITAAAAIMVAVFGAFVLSPEVFLKLIGIGLAAAILDRRDDRADGARAGGDAAARRPQLVAAELDGAADPGR